MFAYYPLPGESGGGGALTIVCVPDDVQSYQPAGYISDTVQVDTNITGGVLPRTVTWRYVSGHTNIIPTSYTGESTSFYAENPDGLPDTFVATWEATVDDGTSTASDQVVITIALGENPP